MVITQRNPTFNVSSATCSDKDFKVLKKSQKVGMIFGSPMTEILEVKNILLGVLKCLPIKSRQFA